MRQRDYDGPNEAFFATLRVFAIFCFATLFTVTVGTQLAQSVGAVTIIFREYNYVRIPKNPVKFPHIDLRRVNISLGRQGLPLRVEIVETQIVLRNTHSNTEYPIVIIKETRQWYFIDDRFVGIYSCKVFEDDLTLSPQLEQNNFCLSSDIG